MTYPMPILYDLLHISRLNIKPKSYKNKKRTS